MTDAQPSRLRFRFTAVLQGCDQFYVDLLPAMKRLGDITGDEEERGRWMARPRGDDAFQPGFASRREAAVWLHGRGDAR